MSEFTAPETVYVIRGEYGRWDEYREWLAAFSESRAGAEAFAAKCTEIAKELHEKFIEDRASWDRRNPYPNSSIWNWDHNKKMKAYGEQIKNDPQPKEPEHPLDSRCPFDYMNEDPPVYRVIEVKRIP